LIVEVATPLARLSGRCCVELRRTDRAAASVDGPRCSEHRSELVERGADPVMYGHVDGDRIVAADLPDHDRVRAAFTELAPYL
jgi:hypothetical protein